jgi:hypothetical protein
LSSLEEAIERGELEARREEAYYLGWLDQKRPKSAE